MAGEVIAGLLGQAKTEPDAFADVMFGKITSTSPLGIRVDNKYDIDENNFQIILSEMVKRKVVTYLYPKVTVVDGTHEKDYMSVPAYHTSFNMPSNFTYKQAEVPYYFFNGQTSSREIAYSTGFFLDSYEYVLENIDIPERTSSQQFVHDINHTKVTVEDIEKEIVLWEDLSVGEEVRMVRGKQAQLYYVIGRA